MAKNNRWIVYTVPFKDVRKVRLGTVRANSHEAAVKNAAREYGDKVSEVLKEK